MMSNSPGREALTDFAKSTVAKPERMFDGFPWLNAIVLYTLSWGWSLLRPNTLYWDDWTVSNKDYPKVIWLSIKGAGLAPWVRFVEWPILEVGVWLIRFLTFAIFFGAAVMCFKILQVNLGLVAPKTQRILVLLFLVVPVNHARISIICFDYSTSYFLFFLGWFVLVHYKSIKSFLLASGIIFLSLKTHSFLFFMFLPFLHYIWINKSELIDFHKLNRQHSQVVFLATIPVAYICARQIFWAPVTSWESYQQPTTAGLMTGLWPVLIGLVGLSVIAIRYAKNKPTHFGFVLFIYGFLVTALALFPYFLAEFYVGYAGRPAYITVFEFRADWRSRHQLLMPLGLALSVVGLNELFKWKQNKNIFAGFIIVVSVALNMFWGSQYFLQSLKQEQLVELLKATKNEIVITSLDDLTLRFNGRENTFRGYEWSGFMTLAGIPTERPGCEALPNGSVLVLKSDKPYLSALISRDLGLYFDVTPCSEVLAKDT